MLKKIYVPLLQCAKEKDCDNNITEKEAIDDSFSDIKTPSNDGLPGMNQKNR